MNKNLKSGLLFGLSAYFLWGILPIYWKQLYHISSFEILANRFIWSSVFAFALILASGQFGVFYDDCKFILASKKRTIALICAAITMIVNWGVFIWAINSDQILASSMGYYINPLVSVLFGMLFLKEILTSRQIAAVAFAFLGTAVMVWQFGKLPWISLALAISFAVYGLIKKQLPISPLTSIALESSLVMPFAIIYEYYMSANGGVYHNIQASDLLLLIGGGIVTAIPLMLFTAAVKRLPLKVVGFLQYVSPTITLLIGVFIYKEVFSSTHLTAFGCIWIGIIIFSLPNRSNRDGIERDNG
ncbi:MAG: EamA family transporter RarD [Elusimicrobiota bacterium]|nr:EamA family transporter RarD [Elusimicrobiota bacterium]